MCKSAQTMKSITLCIKCYTVWRIIHWIHQVLTQYIKWLLPGPQKPVQFNLKRKGRRRGMFQMFILLLTTESSWGKPFSIQNIRSCHVNITSFHFHFCWNLHRFLSTLQWHHLVCYVSIFFTSGSSSSVGELFKVLFIEAERSFARRLVWGINGAAENSALNLTETFCPLLTLQRMKA